MRNLLDPDIDKFRVTDERVLKLWGHAGDESSGAFEFLSNIDRRPLLVIASAGGDWDHISVSRKDRVPNWYEMEFVKRLFFRPDEIAVQFHVPPSQHINRHPNVLHLWRDWKGHRLPPQEYV